MKKDVLYTINDEMIKMFYNFDIDSFENREAKRIIENTSTRNKKLTREISELKLEIVKLKGQLERRRKLTYEDILKDFESRFFYADINSIRSLATAEYLFINEADKLDYSGIFLNFIKGFEIEIRNRLDKSNKMTFGRLLNRLKTITELKTFVEAILKVDIIDVRNKGVHNKSISKIECGKIRKLLIEDRWFDRVSQILNEMENKEVLSERRVYIKEFEGYEIYNGKKYMCFSTNEEICILSKENIAIGIVRLKGKQLSIYGIDYILV